jgi:putative aldouronate transport system substrate-binding protein
MKTDSGKYYGYGFFREDGGWNDTYLGPVVNKAWLDECGLKVPVTVSDWDKVLRTFKQKYNVPMSFAWSRVSGYGTGISGAFGAYSFADYRLYIDKNKKVQLANIQPEYRNQLMKWAEWWRDGLIDQDFLSVNDTMARANALNKKMGIAITSMGQLSNWVTDARNQNTGTNWIGLQYPKGDDGTLVQVAGGYGIGTVVAAVSSSVKDENMELVMRALDYAYTDDGNLYWNFGKKGHSWDYDKNGKPAYLPLVTNDPGGINDAIDKYGGSTWSGNCIQATLLLYLKNTQTAIDANDLWFYPNEKITFPDKMPNGMTLTSQESTRAAELRAAISTFVNETSIQFLTGQANFNTWDAYVSRVNSMGLPELLRIYQAAYDRYLKR